MRWQPTICAFVITVACTCSFLRTCGQDKLDSLLGADKEQVDENKARVNLWVEIAKEYQYTNTAAGLGYADKAIVAAKRLHVTDELGSALDAKGELYYRSGQHKEAIASLDSALEILKKTGDSRGMSKVYADFGMVYWQTSEWKKALEYFKQSIALAEAGKDEQAAGDGYGEIGIIYYEQTDYSRALDYFQKALDIHLKYNDVRSAAQNLQDMGLIYS